MKICWQTWNRHWKNRGIIVHKQQKTYSKAVCKIGVSFCNPYTGGCTILPYLCNIMESIKNYNMESAKENQELKVLLINGSPHRNGNTFIALSEVAKALEAERIKTEIFPIGNRPIQGCIACYKCNKTGICVFKDEPYLTLRQKTEEADGIIIGSPVYFGGPSGTLCSLLDRLFYSSGHLVQYKPAASVVVCRRGGASASFDRLNKYFTILNMPVVASNYWNI